MKTTTQMAFAIAILITVLFAGSVQAQQGAFVSFKGIEITSGHAEPDEVYGWVCYAKTTGALPGNFTLTMDLEGNKAPGTTNSVTGGAWTLPVYGSTIKGTSYRGVLYGNVTAGGVTWDKAGTTGNVELKLIITGSTQYLSGFKGNAVLYGTVNYDEKGGATFNGTMYFKFQ